MTKVGTICVVDDDKVYQVLIKRQIERSNLADKIITFYDGEEAITFLKKQAQHPHELPDVILLDLNMPVMDGWDFLEEYLTLETSLSKSITIYIVSSSVDERDLKKADEIQKVSGYVMKPVTDESLLEIVANLV